MSGVRPQPGFPTDPANPVAGSSGAGSESRPSAPGRLESPDPKGPKGPEKSDNAGGGAKAFLRETAIVLFFAILLSVIVRLFFVQAFYVPSQSMENTLLPNDRILASKITTRIGGVNRGEVVVFKDPGGWLNLPHQQPGPVQRALEFIGLLPSSSGDDLVKRVIGVGGDRVMCCDAKGQIVLNGVSLVETFIKPGGGTDQVQFDVVVSAGNLFVMGDNRAESADSRYHLADDNGGVPVGNVVGRVVLKVWPLSQFSTVGIPEIFENPGLSNQSSSNRSDAAKPSGAAQSGAGGPDPDAAGFANAADLPAAKPDAAGTSTVFAAPAR